MCWILYRPLRAQNLVTISSCPRRQTLPVTFEVDCSHLLDPAAAKQLCAPFAAGKIANLVLLKQSPLETVDAYDSITTVWLHGKPVSRESLAVNSDK